MKTPMPRTRKKSRIVGIDESTQDWQQHQEDSHDHHRHYDSTEKIEDRIQNHAAIRATSLADLDSRGLFLVHLIPSIIRI